MDREGAVLMVFRGGRVGICWPVLYSGNLGLRMFAAESYTVLSWTVLRLTLCISPSFTATKNTNSFRSKQYLQPRHHPKCFM